MKAVQNGKGDRSRNNWGSKWYDGYDAIDWNAKKQQRPTVSPSAQRPDPAESESTEAEKQEPGHR